MKTISPTVLFLMTGCSVAFAQYGYNPRYTGTGNGCQTGGTCYYIDYLSGSDSNSGLSKTLAWKTAPGMSCATGNPANHTFHQTDEFIFKGGVTWPFGCFPWMIASGGAATPNSYAYPGMYVGYDPIWNAGIIASVRVTDPGSCASGTNLSVAFSGGGGSSATATAQLETDPYAAGDLQFVTVTAAGSGYTSDPTVSFTVASGSCTAIPTAYADIYSPVMDGNGTVYGTSSGVPLMFTYLPAYGTLDHIEFKNYLWYAGATFTGGSPNMLATYSAHEVTENVYLHNFGMNGRANSSTLVGARNAAQTCAISGTTLNNSILNNYESEARGCANAYGGSCVQNTATYNFTTNTNNVINAWRAGVYNSSSITSGQVVAGNKMWAILDDANSQHPDSFYLMGGTIAYNNILRDIYNGAAAFYLETSDGGNPTAKGMTTYLFNNVVFGQGANGSGTSTPPIGWTSEFVSSSATGYSPAPDLRAYNNTFYSNNGTSSCMSAGQWFGASGTLSSSYSFTLANNFCVSTQAATHWFGSNAGGEVISCTNGCGLWNGNTQPNSSGTQALIDHVNVIATPTSAASQSYTSSNNYAPTLTSNSSVKFASGGNSQNLTSLCSTSVGGVSLAPLCSDITGNPRPATGGWQAGAYNAYGSVNPPTSLTVSTQ